MKTIPLGELVREPKKVKKWTHAGLSVEITEHGVPLWIVAPAPEASAQAARREAIEEEMAGLLGENRSGTSLSRIIKESRP